MAPFGARAGELHGGTSLQYSSNSRDDWSATLDERYYLEWRQRVTAPLGYRLVLAFEEGRSGEKFRDLRDGVHRRAWNFTPALDFVYRNEGFVATAAYNRLYTADYPKTGGVVRNRLEFFQATGRSPQGTLPAIDLRVDRTSMSGDSTDSTATEIRGNFTYSGEQWRIMQLNRIGFFQYAGLLTTKAEPGIALQGEQNVFGAAINAQYRGTYRREWYESIGLPISTPQIVPPSRGLNAVDPLPLDGSLTEVPALIDGNENALTSIFIGGPSAVVSQNLGVDMVRFVELDHLYVSVRKPSGALATSGGPITWTAYTSSDGTTWVAAGGVEAVFNATVSRWEIGFPRVTNRFFKVVNFGVAADDTVVTEIMPIVVETLSPEQTDVRSGRRQQATGSMQWPTLQLGKLGIGYGANLAWNHEAGDFTRRPTYDVAWSQTVSGNLGPFGITTLNAGYTMQGLYFSNAYGSRKDTVSAGARFDFREGWSGNVSAARGFERTVLGTTDTATIGAGNQLQLRGSITLDQNVSYSVYQMSGGLGSGERFAVGLSTGAPVPLTRTLRAGATVVAGAQSARRGDLPTTSGVPIAPPGWQHEATQTYTLDLNWFPSTQLSGRGRFGYAKSDTFEGMVQGYSVYWTPLSGGALRLSGSYSEDIDWATGRRLRRLDAAPSWTLSGPLVLDVRYQWSATYDNQGNPGPAVHAVAVRLTASM